MEAKLTCNKRKRDNKNRDKVIESHKGKQKVDKYDFGTISAEKLISGGESTLSNEKVSEFRNIKGCEMCAEHRKNREPALCFHENALKDGTKEKRNLINFAQEIFQTKVTSFSIIKENGCFICQDTSFSIVKENICSICQDLLVNNKFFLRCGHLFHADCIGTWFEEKRSCPNCNAEIEIDVTRESFIRQRFVFRFVCGIAGISSFLFAFFNTI